MVRIEVPLLVIPTNDARSALGSRVTEAGLAAYREIAMAANGLEIAHLQFVFHGMTLAVCSRVRRDGIVAIEHVKLRVCDRRPHRDRVVTALDFRA